MMTVTKFVFYVATTQWVTRNLLPASFNYLPERPTESCMTADITWPVVTTLAVGGKWSFASQVHLPAWQLHRESCMTTDITWPEVTSLAVGGQSVCSERLRGKDLSEWERAWQVTWMGTLLSVCWPGCPWNARTERERGMLCAGPLRVCNLLGKASWGLLWSAVLCVVCWPHWESAVHVLSWASWALLWPVALKAVVCAEVLHAGLTESAVYLLGGASWTLLWTGVYSMMVCTEELCGGVCRGFLWVWCIIKCVNCLKAG